MKASGFPGEYGFPVIKTARELNFEKGVTSLALGILTGLTRLVEKKSMEAAIKKNFSGKTVQANLRLFKWE